MNLQTISGNGTFPDCSGDTATTKALITSNGALVPGGAVAATLKTYGSSVGISVQHCDIDDDPATDANWVTVYTFTAAGKKILTLEPGYVRFKEANYSSNSTGRIRACFNGKVTQGQ